VAELQNIELAEPFSFTKGCRTMRIEAASFFSPYDYGALLFDLAADPGQEHPIVDDEIERRMIELMVELMRANDAPPDQYERLGLAADGAVTDAHLQLERGSAPARAVVVRYDRHTKLGALLDDDQARDVLERHVPGLLSLPRMDMARGSSLAQLSRFARELLPGQVLQEVERELLLLAPPGAAGADQG
jgi:hypothetical protein